MPSISSEAVSIKDELISLRRKFHRFPEPGFEEYRTSQVIAEKLRSYGLDVKTGVAKTGVVGLLRGGTTGKTVMVRADMDALPVDEENQADYRSENKGFMHACGHDGHMAIALMAAKLLSERKDNLRGNVKFVFQPAEEEPGGAGPMIAEGVLDDPKVDAAIGLHIWNDLSSGKVGIRSGPLMAFADKFEAVIHGRGGHGAGPHQTVDAILVGCQAVSMLQSIVSRNISPIEPAVVTVGTFHSGTKFNIIADTAEICGTVRSFDPQVRDNIIGRIEEIIKGVTSAMGASYEFKYTRRFPMLVNDESMCEIVRACAVEVVGDGNVIVPEPSMGGEDMALFLEKVPGCYFFLGSANPNKGFVHPHHSPKFDFDEDVLPIGVEVVLRSVERYLQLPGN